MNKDPSAIRLSSVGRKPKKPREKPKTVFHPEPLQEEEHEDRSFDWGVYTGIIAGIIIIGIGTVFAVQPFLTDPIEVDWEVPAGNEVTDTGTVIQGDVYLGQGLVINSSDYIVRDCMFIGCPIGIQIMDNLSQIVIDSCTFNDNNISIDIGESSSILVIRCLFNTSRNLSIKSHPESEGVTVADCIFINDNSTRGDN